MKIPNILEGHSWNEPTPIDHDAFHERVVAWTVKMFDAKPADEALIGIFIFAGMGFTTVVDGQWHGENAKYDMAHSVRRMLNSPLAKEAIEAYAFVTEAWAVAAKKGQTMEEIGAPSKHPDREDVLMITTTLRSGASKTTRFGVKTYPGLMPFMPPKKKPRLLERDDQASEGDMVGTMANFFDSEEEMQRKIKEKKGG